MKYTVYRQRLIGGSKDDFRDHVVLHAKENNINYSLAVKPEMPIGKAMLAFKDAIISMRCQREKYGKVIGHENTI